MPEVPRNSGNPTHQKAWAKCISSTKLRLARGMRAGLAVLWEAFEYGSDLGENQWQYGVGLATLFDLGLSENGLRWLVGGGLADHALEVNRSEDTVRHFERPPRPVFSGSAIFKLTPSGAALARAICGRLPAWHPQPRSSSGAVRQMTSADRSIPTWDRNRHELKVGSIVVLRYKLPAPAQEAVLSAFEEVGWPQRIDNPLSESRHPLGIGCLSEAVEALNRSQKLLTVRFADNGGQAVQWEMIGGRWRPATRRG